MDRSVLAGIALKLIVIYGHARVDRLGDSRREFIVAHVRHVQQ